MHDRALELLRSRNFLSSYPVRSPWGSKETTTLSDADQGASLHLFCRGWGGIINIHKSGISIAFKDSQTPWDARSPAVALTLTIFDKSGGGCSFPSCLPKSAYVWPHFQQLTHATVCTPPATHWVLLTNRTLRWGWDGATWTRCVCGGGDNASFHVVSNACNSTLNTTSLGMFTGDCWRFAGLKM